eukprot:scaffold1277_cov253-Pinguiococcus_pyrenoidosus.AAC.37
MIPCHISPTRIGWTATVNPPGHPNWRNARFSNFGGYPREVMAVGAYHSRSAMQGQFFASTAQAKAFTFDCGGHFSAKRRLRRPGFTGRRLWLSAPP